ncbi:MAG: carbamoyltransferase HypF [Bacteroidota bacterium]|nr:carbamoyltransferase HypF [Bacteroidota bacterium]
MMKQSFHIKILGVVQGVGFRPFVYRLAKDFNLTGWVLNSAQGVFIEAEGQREDLEIFLFRLEKEKPRIASIHSLEYSVHDVSGYEEFEIRHSQTNGKKIALILPDIATCPDCLQELLDPNDRRYRYPFTNCTNCGPRFSIIESLPYDRQNTSMKNFIMCVECKNEYEDPGNRRFHAQPNACANCGPHLELWNQEGKIITSHHDALLQAADALRIGKILALKGIGGFQLMVDARNNSAVTLLRKRKHRDEKPFALMYPSLEFLKRDCISSAIEERMFFSPASPIVLLKRRMQESEIASSVAPNNPNLGGMLPYTPLHHLLLNELGFPVVATSGNLSDEPICIDEHEALRRLENIADIFLVNNRPIVRHIDDSVARVILGNEQILRRSRGYAPLPIHLKNSIPPMIAVGAHLKNTIAMSNGTEIFTSQHIGDLETSEAYSAFQKVISDFQQLYEVSPKKIVCDMHPEYLSTKYANKLSGAVIPVQHHYAHVMACIADNELEGTVLGVSWDGTGYGKDETIWGSEFLLTNENSFERVAHFSPFKLPGGEASIKNPSRNALGVLYEIFGEEVFTRTELIPLQNFSQKELSLLQQVLKKNLNSPLTTSAGRMFDAVAALIGLRQMVNFEGQAAMELEFAIQQSIEESYPFEVLDKKPFIINWQPMILKIIDDVRDETSINIVSAKFHNTLSEIIVNIANKICESKIVLTGGCFQNKYLTERTVTRLKEEGFNPYWHQRIPPNDGGIAAGQIMAASKLMQKKLNKNVKFQNAEV